MLTPKKKKVYAFCINGFVLLISTETLAGYFVSHGKTLIPQAMAMHFVPEQLSLQLKLHCPAPLSDVTLAKA